MTVRMQPRGNQWQATFQAMASPCEVLLDETDAVQTAWLGGLAADETLRIQAKFSRYRDDNIIHAINTSAGRPVTVDEETAGLLNFAARCHELSNGRFDITSGVLRRLWTFDGSDRLPSRGQVKQLLPMIGWQKVGWSDPVITLPAGMEIDLGGLGKEYAVDRVTSLLAEKTAAAFLVNFGGDLRAHGRLRDGQPWRVGVERPGFEKLAALNLQLKQGALATSGDANRYLLKDGERYSHILNPRTGWPVRQAPRSVTVLAETCTQAGLLATLAMLQGQKAETFLAEQGGQHWIIR